MEDILKKDVDGLIIEPSKSQLVCRHEHLYRMLDEYEIPYILFRVFTSRWRRSLIFSWTTAGAVIL